MHLFSGGSHTASTQPKKPQLRLITGGSTSPQEGSDDPPHGQSSRPICAFCKKPIADDEIIAELEGQPYHADCQRLENDRFAWQATKDGIRLGLGVEIRQVFPGGHGELDELRSRLAEPDIRFSAVFQIVATISHRIRGSLDRCGLGVEQRRRCEDNLTGISKHLSDYLKGRSLTERA